GVPNESLVGISEDVKELVSNGLELLKEEGATVQYFDLEALNYGVPAYYIIAPAEASSNLERFDGIRYGLRKDADDLKALYHKTRGAGFGSEVKRRIILGTFTLSSGYYDAYYLKAQKVRTMIQKGFNEAFSNFDLLITPTAPTPAFKLGEIKDPLSMYLSEVATIPVSLAGLPAISVPCGFSNDLPVGLQMIAPSFDEETLLKTAHRYESKAAINTVPYLIQEQQ
ncbi:MAG: Asp-tRNA(Asn)/Glu-tRNA(Gln) amidotransferase subunit GatA, partial [Candidatus Margulisbacteria bacterium]|nr:Asp-tRNA(Asn)/Glu-tRNA(Gln) amidotransferase subunit GatA [Candidatus Margulisiibacteriota bacterium]